MYLNNYEGRSVWRYKLNGDRPEKLPYRCTDTPVFSPDSKSAACFEQPSEPDSEPLVKIYEFEKGVCIKQLKLPTAVSSEFLCWSPDGKSLGYIDGRGRTSNVGVVSLNEDQPPKLLTHFNTLMINAFDWSADGKKLLCERGLSENNVVLLTNQP